MYTAYFCRSVLPLLNVFRILPNGAENDYDAQTFRPDFPNSFGSLPGGGPREDRRKETTRREMCRRNAFVSGVLGAGFFCGDGTLGGFHH